MQLELAMETIISLRQDTIPVHNVKVGLITATASFDPDEVTPSNYQEDGKDGKSPLPKAVC